MQEILKVPLHVEVLCPYPANQLQPPLNGFLSDDIETFCLGDLLFKENEVSNLPIQLPFALQHRLPRSEHLADGILQINLVEGYDFALIINRILKSLGDLLVEGQIKFPLHVLGDKGEFVAFRVKSMVFIM